MAANVKWETLGDLIAKDWNLGVACRCGHVGTVDARQANRWFGCHGWDTRKSQLWQHLKCSHCRRVGRYGRIVSLGVSADTPTPFHKYPTDEAGWQRLVKRLRG